MEKSWRLIYTQPRFERRVAEFLEKNHVETFLPLNRRKRFWSGKSKLIATPLFPRYLFARVDDSKIKKILSVEGVVSLVYWQSRICIIRDEEVDFLKRLVYDYSNIVVKKTKINYNESLRVTSGPLIDSPFGIMSLDHQYKSAYLPSLGYELKFGPDGEVPHRVRKDSVNLIFDAEEFSPQDIANVLLELSALYRSIGGDKLIIRKEGSFEFMTESEYFSA